MPPPEARPGADRRSRSATSPGIDALAEALALAGYERVERVEERGQFAVRGGLVDVFPTTGREPLRIELFGDEIEAIRAFSPFTQRALHPVDERRRLPGGRAARSTSASRRSATTTSADASRTTSSRRSTARPDLVWRAGRGARGLGGGGLERELPLDGAAELDPFPRGAAVRVRGAAARRSPRAASPRPRHELAAFVRAGHRVVVAFPHRGEALRTQNLLRRVEARLLEPGDALPDGAGAPLRRLAGAARLRLARPRARPAPGHAGLPQAAAARATRRLGRALQSFADLRTGDYVVHEDHGVGKLLGFETKEVAGVTRDYLFLAFRGDDRLYVPHEQIGKVSRYIGADAQRARALASSAARPGSNLKSRARASRCASSPASCSRSTRSGSRRPGVAFDLEDEWLERLEAEFPYRETEDQQRAIEAVKEDLEAPRPMDRLVCGDVGFGKTEVAVRAAFAVARQRQADADARARRRSSPSSTGTRSASATATSRCASRWSRASAAPADVEAGARRLRRRARSTSSSARTASSRAT